MHSPPVLLLIYCYIRNKLCLNQSYQYSVKAPWWWSVEPLVNRCITSVPHFFQEVVLEADTGLDHRSVSSIITYSTGAVQVPSRGHSRGLHQSWYQADRWPAGHQVSYRHWRQQTQQEDRQRIQGINRTLSCLSVCMEKARDYVYHVIKRLSLLCCFLLSFKNINGVMSRPLVLRVRGSRLAEFPVQRLGRSEF